MPSMAIMYGPPPPPGKNVRRSPFDVGDQPGFVPFPTTPQPVIDPPPPYADASETAVIAALEKLASPARERVLQYAISRWLPATEKPKKANKPKARKR